MWRKTLDKIKAEWFKGISSEEDKDRIRRLVLSNTLFSDKLAEIIQHRIDADVRKMGSESFESPAWSEKMAHHLGKQKAYQNLLDLLPLTEGE